MAVDIPARCILSKRKLVISQQYRACAYGISHTSTAFTTRTSLVDSPPMATTTPDARFVPLRQSYPADMEVQEANLGQSYNQYGQAPFTNESAADSTQPCFNADTTHSESPLFLPHSSRPMRATASTQPGLFDFPHTFSAASPSLDRKHSTVMQHQRLQQAMSDPSWSAAASCEGRYFDQHCQQPVTHPYQFNPPQHHHSADQGFLSDVYPQQPTYPAPPQQFNQQSCMSASPYPEIPYSEPDTFQYAGNSWQPFSDEDSGGSGDSGYDGKLNTSYAHLIYMCLLEAPNHSRKLKEIYDWIRIRTNKADDLTTNGWQNSVRHNLSMNKVCVSL